MGMEEEARETGDRGGGRKEDGGMEERYGRWVKEEGGNGRKVIEDGGRERRRKNNFRKLY